MTKTTFTQLSLIVALGLATHASAERVLLTLSAPTIDRWMYPFGGSPGTEAAAPLFGAFGTPDFDNRDGQFYFLFDTSGTVPAGLPTSAYSIVSATVTIENDNDVEFIYDDSTDSWQSFLSPSDPLYVPDEDEGQPLELWGAGFRNGFAAATFPEDGPFAVGAPLGKGARNVYAARFDESGEAIDVSNSADEQYDPTPWAIGIIDGVSPGEFVPVGSKIRYDLNLDQPGVHGALATGLSAGAVPFVATSFTMVEFMGGSFARIRTKENGLVQFGLASAATLDLIVDIAEEVAGDLNGDGSVNAADLAILLGQWGGAGSGDLDGSGTVDAADLALLLGAWN